MSYDTARPYNPEQVFSGWYVDNTPENSLNDKFSPYLRNARLDWTAIINRPGHTLFQTLTAWTYPRGIWSYLRSVSTNDRIIVRHNTDATHKLYTVEEDWTLTSIVTSTDIASDNRMNYLNIGDVIYCMNGSDDYGKLNWITYTTPSTWITNFAPSFAISFNGSCFASWWSTHSNIVYKSEWDNYEKFNWSGSDTFTFEENITWLAVNNQSLFYFTKNTISVTGKWDIQDIWGTINYLTRPLTVKEWAVNYSSIVNVGTNIYYWTPSNKISKIARGANIDWFEVQEISDRKYAWLDGIMKTLDLDQTDSFGYYLPENDLIKWFVKSINSTFNDVCIIYDVSKDAFLIDDNKYFYWGVNFKGKNYTISMIEPKIYQDEYWSDDEDAAISFIYETKYFDLQVPQTKKELWSSDTYIAINDLASLTQQIIIDGNSIDTKIINSDNIPISISWIWTKSIWTYWVWTWWGYSGDSWLYNIVIRRTKWDLQSKWYKVKFLFIDSEIWSKIRLETLSMRLEILPMEANNLTI